MKERDFGVAMNVLLVERCLVRNAISEYKVFEIGTAKLEV